MNGWIPVAIKRIDEALFNIEFDIQEQADWRCPVCYYIKAHQPHYKKEKQCWVFWTSYYYCPAIESCKEFSYIMNEMKQKSAKIRRLKALKSKLGRFALFGME